LCFIGFAFFTPSLCQLGFNFALPGNIDTRKYHAFQFPDAIGNAG